MNGQCSALALKRSTNAAMHLYLLQRKLCATFNLLKNSELILLALLSMV